MWYYKVKSRWEEDVEKRICNKVTFTYQGEAYRATVPELFKGTGTVGYQTKVDHYLTKDGQDTVIREEVYGYHVDKHVLLKYYQRTQEGMEELTDYSYDDRKCPAKKVVSRKKTSCGNYQKILEHTYTYDYLDRLISANLYDPLVVTGSRQLHHGVSTGISDLLSDPLVATDSQQLDLVREYFGYDSRIHPEKYLPEADLNHDQIIDGVDFALAAAQYKGGGLTSDTPMMQ